MYKSNQDNSVPENFNTNKNCKHNIYFDFTDVSSLKLLVSLFPDVSFLSASGTQSSLPVGQNEILELHSLFGKCKNLTNFCLCCKLSNLKMFKETFSDWTTVGSWTSDQDVTSISMSKIPSLSQPKIT
jgi:hypothetical protein